LKKTSINSIFSNPKLISPFSLSQPPPLPVVSSLKSAFFSLLSVSASHLLNLSSPPYSLPLISQICLRVSQIQLKEYDILALSGLSCVLDKEVQDAVTCNLLHLVEQSAILMMFSYGTDVCHCLPFYREDLLFFGLWFNSATLPVLAQCSFHFQTVLIIVFWDLDCKLHATDLKASTETKMLKNVVNKKPKKNSTGIISVWIGLEGKQTEPNRTEINRFEPVFGSKTKIK